MEQEHKKLVALIKEQVEIEKDHVQRLSEMQKKMRYAAARLLVLEMKLDSEKHAAILTAILETLKGIPHSTALWDYELESYIDPVLAKRELETHVKQETEVLAHIENELGHTKDEGLRLLLQNIQDDEKKHHGILQTIVKNMYKINP